MTFSAPDMDTYTFPSYAKINIGLSIQGKRADGYHNIETVFQQVDLSDILEIKILQDDVVLCECDDPEIPTDHSNLIVQAASLLKQESGRMHGVSIHLRKRIPAGAGLGGGSSNAAVTLFALSKLWGLGLPLQKLTELGMKLGADVPFFIKGGTAVGLGKGDMLQPLMTEGSAYVLLVLPGIHISTRWAYEQINLDLTKKKKNSTFKTFKSINFNKVEFFNSITNEFENPVFLQYPVLAEIKSKLYEKGAFFASLSGSGSTLFGLFSGEKEALEAKEELAEQHRTQIVHPIAWGCDQVT